jgi:GMP synthase-like glutamine amidotransferase
MPQKRCLVVQHVDFEGPGRVGRILEESGWEARTVRPFEGDAVPDAPPGNCGALVVLGGPMSAWDEVEHPFLAREKALLRRAIADDFPTLGICLGAQLLADAAGARVVRGVKPEIGWLPAALTDKGESDFLFRHLPVAFQPFHWHGDTFDLPRRAVHLAKSMLYTRQAFRLGENVYGVQFHLEVDEALLEAWRPHLPPEAAAQDHAEHLGALAPRADRFFRAFLDRTGAR